MGPNTKGLPQKAWSLIRSGYSQCKTLRCPPVIQSLLDMISSATWLFQYDEKVIRHFLRKHLPNNDSCHNLGGVG